MMKKDFKNRHATRRRTPAESRRRLVIGASVLGCLLVISGLVAVGYSQPQIFQYWVSKSRQHLHRDLAKVKQLAVKTKEGPPPIHFEFYTALPNMQVGNVPSLPKAATPVAKVNTRPVIVSANELEKEFSAHIKQFEANKKR